MSNVRCALQEIEGQLDSERKYVERLAIEDFGTSRMGRVRKTLWNLTEYPETSVWARVGHHIEGG